MRHPLDQPNSVVIVLPRPDDTAPATGEKPKKIPMDIASQLDTLMTDYEAAGIDEYTWKPFVPGMKNSTWYHVSFDPPEKQPANQSDRGAYVYGDILPEFKKGGTVTIAVINFLRYTHHRNQTEYGGEPVLPNGHVSLWLEQAALSPEVMRAAGK